MDPWGWAMMLAAAWLLAAGFRVRWRWRLRGIPLARPAPFLLGHMWTFYRVAPMYLCYERFMRRFGGIFWVLLGKTPVVVLSDPDLIRQVAVKHFVKFHDRPSFVAAPRSMRRSKRLVAIQSGLLVARGGYWGSLRAALNPLFHTKALDGYGGVINACVGRFLERLEAASGEGASDSASDGGGKGGGKGEGGAPAALDVHALLGRMTMEVIGRSAFGVEFVTEGDEQDRAAGKPNLVAAVKIIFSSAGFTPGGAGAGTLFRLLPDWAEPILFTIFFTAVGAVAKRFEYARATLMSTADVLMQAAKRRSVAQGEPVQMVDTDWRWWSDEFAAANPYQGTVPAPNSVVDLLMRATNKETGRGLTDVQIASQCNTVIAAGYETTANALAFAIYLLATHPEAEAKMLAEIDAFGGGEPGPGDADAFPYVQAVMDEALRLYPPAHTTNRECTAAEGCTLVGQDGSQYHVPHRVHFNIWGLHHSEDHWREPYSFRPERFLDAEEVAGRHPGAYMPFGLGPRNCVGFRFALLEMRIALVRIYQRWTFRLAPQQEQPLALRMGITLSPKGGVWVTPQRRGVAS